MLDKSLATSYARALYNEAKKQDAIASVLLEVGGFSQALFSDELLKKFFFHPAISPSEKKSMLGEMPVDSLSGLSKNFISVLLDTKRINYLEFIYQIVLDLHHRDQNKVTVRASSAFPIGEALLEKIKRRAALYLQKDIDLRSDTDSKLLGGLKLTIDDRVIDGSVSYHLKKLEEKIA